MNSSTPVRVLHLLAELGGGGSERWLRDLVRLSPPGLEHRVQTIYSGRVLHFEYAEELRRLGAYEFHPPVPLVSPRVLQSFRARWTHGPQWLRVAARGAACIGALRPTLITVRSFQPQVIHCHTLPDFVVGLLASRAAKVPLMHTVPCLFSQMDAEGYGWMPALYARVHPAVACFSTGESQSELTSVGVPAHKILYDLGGVDLEAVAAILSRREIHAREIRRNLGIPVNCPVALSVGRLHSSKGHLAGIQILKAMLQDVSDLHLMILGEGAERRTLEEEAVVLGVRERVHFVGFTKDPLPYYAASDVYLRTTLFEAENLSFYAAMAMGLPVVGFDTGEGRDLVRAVGCGEQVAKGDVAGFARAATRLLEKMDRGRSVGAAGAAYAREHLDVGSSVSRLTRVYRELAGDPLRDDVRVTKSCHSQAQPPAIRRPR